MTSEIRQKLSRRNNTVPHFSNHRNLPVRQGQRMVTGFRIDVARDTVFRSGPSAFQSICAALRFKRSFLTLQRLPRMSVMVSPDVR
jgi:hypothetical protein